MKACKFEGCEGRDEGRELRHGAQPWDWLAIGGGAGFWLWGISVFRSLGNTVSLATLQLLDCIARNVRRLVDLGPGWTGPGIFGRSSFSVASIRIRSTPSCNIPIYRGSLAYRYQYQYGYFTFTFDHRVLPTTHIAKFVSRLALLRAGSFACGMRR